MPDLIEMIVFNVFTNRRGPNIEADGKSAYNNMQVGEQRNKFWEKYHFYPTLKNHYIINH